jgi:hypothetical protein
MEIGTLAISIEGMIMLETTITAMVLWEMG